VFSIDLVCCPASFSICLWNAFGGNELLFVKLNDTVQIVLLMLLLTQHSRHAGSTVIYYKVLKTSLVRIAWATATLHAPLNKEWEPH
jgi:hypothetical protein